MNTDGFEIERKFLIAMPDREILEGCKDVSEIEQIYLEKHEGMRARIRKRSYPDKTVYTHTQKKHITDIRRIELEREISGEEYALLMDGRDRKRSIIRKTRYCIEHEGKLFEIDIFPFWSDRAFMEIELCTEDESFTIPEGIKVYKEITEDRRYTNASLAKAVPYDALEEQ